MKDAASRSRSFEIHRNCPQESSNKAGRGHHFILPLLLFSEILVCAVLSLHKNQSRAAEQRGNWLNWEQQVHPGAKKARLSTPHGCFCFGHIKQRNHYKSRSNYFDQVSDITKLGPQTNTVDCLSAKCSALTLVTPDWARVCAS